jgi:hypothetical protein
LPIDLLAHGAEHLGLIAKNLLRLVELLPDFSRQGSGG